MLYILIVIAIVLVETKIKNYIDENKELSEKQDIFNGKVTIKKQYNRGIFMNLFEDRKDMVKTVTGLILCVLCLIFIFILPRKGMKLFKLGLSLCLGGAISNTADRLEKGHVIDYFSINKGKLKSVVFNLSDMFIFLGSLLILLSSLFTKRKSCFDETGE